MRVLVIEDDDEVAEGIAVGLRRAGMAVDVAFDGTTGLELARPGVHDVVVLDRDLPGLHGDKVCAALVQGENPPGSSCSLPPAKSRTESTVSPSALTITCRSPSP